MQATVLIPETSEEVVNTKLDVLLSASFIAVQFYDVSDQDIVRFVEVRFDPETFSCLFLSIHFLFFKIFFVVDSV